ncbi:hypothetical protein [Kitasatospora sp. NPDC058218]|uniref:hypothetical protein n=1 Tax=Kitasatospora sp. NPDC058218 TaxID=3346385 RepID=UPI0036DB0085
MLLHDDDPVIGTSRSLSHERHVTPIYADYQRHLHLQMHRLVDEGRWAETVVIGERRVVAVQDELRRRLHPITPLVPPGALPGVRVVALGGMSESGKSTTGEYLRIRHGYARLKIGHLIDDAAQRAGIASPYEIPAVVRAELLIDGLDRFCAAHHFLDRVTIESLHDQDATAELRRKLGEQLTVVYVDATPEVRAERGTAGPEDVIERDAVKARRGAAGIAALAQEIVDNNHSRLHLERRLDGIALAHRWPLRQPATAPVNTLGLPVHLESYLSALLDRTTVQQHPLCWLDFQYAGRNTLAGEIAILLWYLVGMGGWLVPTYQPDIYAHTLPLHLPPITTPHLEHVDHDERHRRLEVRYTWPVGAGRHAAINRRLERVHADLARPPAWTRTASSPRSATSSPCGSSV